MRKSDGTIVKGVAADADPIAQDFGIDYLITLETDALGDYIYVTKDFFNRPDIEIIEE